MRRSYTEEDITAGLMAMIAWAGNSQAAAKYLKAEKQIDVPLSTLNSWKRVHGTRYEELREKYSGEMEASLAHEFRDVARLAVEAERLAIEKATARLRKGEDQDPGRTAANLSRVAQSSTDKLMTVTSRPTQITETRGAQEIVRSLMSRGIIRLPPGEGEGKDE